jgi:two-component system phosphate regulon response regulator OmpR
VLSTTAHQLTRDGEPVALTSGEFDLLAVLATHPNKVLHRDRILDLLTGAERSPFDRSIDVRVTRLRGKIEHDPSRPAYIRTIWGKGYMFCPEGHV